MAKITREKRREYYKRWYDNGGKEYLKIYNQKIAKKRNAYRKQWAAKNRDKQNAYYRQYINRRRREDPKYRIHSGISSAISYSLKGKKAWRNWEKLVGYSIEDLIRHLEQQFDDNMSWSNYGTYWHIDHKKPKSWFNYTNPEDKEFRECWGLLNLQPLEKGANMRKGDKFSS